MKRIQCLPNPSQHVPIYLQQFSSYSNRKCKNRCFHVPQPTFRKYHEMCCMDGKTIESLPNPSQPSMFNSFPVIRTSSTKKSPFSRAAAHIFLFPGDATATITQYVPWMERQFNACQTPRSIYLSIFNSFRVIRCLSQCVSPKIAIFTTFLFPLGMPLGQSR